MADEQTPDQTAQIPVSEPLPQAEANAANELAQPVSESQENETQAEPVVSQPAPTASAGTSSTASTSSRQINSAQADRDLLIKARATIQSRKQRYYLSVLGCALSLLNVPA